MAAILASSPVAAHSSNFKSPLRGFMVESSDRGTNEDFYADAHARIAQWRRDVAISASMEAQQGLRELRHERQHLKGLEADVAGLQVLVEAASQLQAGGARLAKVVDSSHEAAGSRASALGSVCSDLRGLHEKRTREVHEIEANNEQKQQSADAKHVEALKLLDVYKDRLGLEIRRVAPQTVRMAFSLLDEWEPGREFFFTLGLATEDGADGATGNAPRAGTTIEHYCVTECVPPVPEFPQLLKELNAHASSSTALPRFTCSMRRAFLKVVQKDVCAA